MDPKTETEKTFRLSVTYRLSQAGQKEAVRRGIPAQAEHTAECDAPIGWLDTLPIVFDAEGRASLDLRKKPAGDFAFDAPPADPLAAVETWRAAVEADAAAKAADFAKRKAAFLASNETYVPYHDLEDDPDVQAARRARRKAAFLAAPRAKLWEHEFELRDDPDVLAAIERVKAAETERAERMVRQRQEQDAETARKAAERRAWTLMFLAENGTPDQAERYAAGVLPADELRVALERFYLRPLDTFERFERVAAADVCEECWERVTQDRIPENDLFSFPVETATELSGAQWTRLQAIRKALPEGATAEPRLRSSECDCPEHTETGHGYGPEAYDVLVKLSTPAGVDLRVSLALPE